MKLLTVEFSLSLCVCVCVCVGGGAHNRRTGKTPEYESHIEKSKRKLPFHLWLAEKKKDSDVKNM